MTDITYKGQIVKARTPKLEKFEYDFRHQKVVEPFIKECVNLGWPGASISIDFVREYESVTDLEGNKSWEWDLTVNGFKTCVVFKGTFDHASCMFTPSKPVRAHRDEDPVEDASCGVKVVNDKITWTWTSQKGYIETLFETMKVHVDREDAKAQRKRRP